MIVQFLKVSGQSLWPLYQDGDYVLAAHPALAGAIKPGDVIIFHQADYGTMIKQVERLLPESNQIFVIGTHAASADSRHFGPIKQQAVIGKVIWHLKRPAGTERSRSKRSKT